jgi:hypothetical protein
MDIDDGPLQGAKFPQAGHWMNNYTVYSPTNSDWDFTTNYLNVVVAQTATNSTLIIGP